MLEVNNIVSKIVISVLCLVSMEQICVDVWSRANEVTYPVIIGADGGAHIIILVWRSPCSLVAHVASARRAARDRIFRSSNISIENWN